MSSVSTLSIQEWWVVALKQSLCSNRISGSFSNSQNLRLMWFQRSELASLFWKHRKRNSYNCGVYPCYAMFQCLLNTLIESLSLNLLEAFIQSSLKNALNEGMLCVSVTNGALCATMNLVAYFLWFCVLLLVSCFLESLPFPLTELKSKIFLHCSFPEACLILPYPITVSHEASRNFVSLGRSGSGSKPKLFQLHVLAFRAGQKLKLCL